MKGWIGVDLDGTLAQYDHWRGIEHIGAGPSGAETAPATLLHRVLFDAPLVDGAPVERVAPISVDGPLPLDIDTQADYVRVCELFGYAPGPAEPRSPQV